MGKWGGAVTAGVESALGFWQWLLRSSFQGSLLVLVVLAVQVLFRRRLAPRWRHALWLVVVVRLALPATVSSPWSLYRLADMATGERAWGRSVPDRVAAPAVPDVALGLSGSVDGPPSPFLDIQPSAEDPQSVRSEANGPGAGVPGLRQKSAVRHSIGVADMLAGIWVIGVLLFGGWLVGATWRMSRRLRQCEPIRDAELLGVLDDCRVQVVVRLPLMLVETDQVTSPALCGWRRPRLLLPPGLLRELSRAELRHVFLHELAHVRRHDIAVNWCCALLQVLHWFNPVIWYGFARMRGDREMACDELALRAAGPGVHRAYGQTMIRLLEGFSRPSPAPGLIGILENDRQIKRRLRAIAAYRPRRGWSLWGVGLISATVALGLTDTPSDVPTEMAEAVDALAREVILEVVDAETGEPLSNAEAAWSVYRTLTGDPADRSDGRVRADRHGVMKVAVPSDVRTLKVSALASDHIPRGVRWADVASMSFPVHHQLALGRGVTIGGVVRDEQDRPVAGARLRFPLGESEDWKPGALYAERDGVTVVTAEWGTTVTGEDGRWSWTHAPPDPRSFAIYITHPESSSAYLTLRQGDSALPGEAVGLTRRDLEARGAVTVLRRGGEIRGKVIGPDGEPIQGAGIWRLGEGNGPPPAVTDPDGRFVLAGIPEGETEISVYREGYAPARATAVAGPESDALRIHLGEPGLLRGRVMEAGGGPVAGAKVSLAGWRGQDPLQWETVTDGDGRFQWASAPSDEPVSIDVSARGFMRHRDLEIRSDGAEHPIELRKNLKVSGRVVDAATGSPIERFTVVQGYVQGMTIGPCWFNRFGRHATDGRYAVSFEFAEDAYLVRIVAEGYLDAVSEVRPMPGSASEAEVDFALSRPDVAGPESLIAGTVFLPDGEPAAGAQIALCTFMVAPNLAGDRLEPSGSGSVDIRTCDNQGRFELSPDPDAHTLVAVHSQGYAESPLWDRAGPIDVHLARWGRIEGTVLNNGEPAAGQDVWLFRQGLVGAELPQFSSRRRDSNKTDERGQFVIEKVPPCDVRLGVLAERVLTVSYLRYPTPVHVAPGTVTRVQLGGSGTRIEGRCGLWLPSRPVEWNGPALDSGARPSVGYAMLKRKLAPLPKAPDPSDKEARRRWIRKYSLSESGRARIRDYLYFPVEFEDSGRFVIQAVPAGEYTLQITVQEPGSPHPTVPSIVRPGPVLARIERTIIVPEPAGPSGEAVLDLGLLRMKMEEDEN